MAFDLTHAFTEGYAESQLGEGGANAVDNCVVTTFSLILMALGYPDIEPQTWTNFEYGTAYHGYTSFQAAIAFMNSHFPNPPSVSLENPTDSASYVDAAGQLGYPCAVQFHCDSNANLVPNGTGSHICPVLRFDGTYFTVLNVWQGKEVGPFTRAQFNALCLNPDGWITRFNRPVGEAMTPQQAAALAGFLVVALGRLGMTGLPNNNDEIGNAILSGNYQAALNLANGATVRPPSGGVTLAQVQAEIVKALKAGEAGA